MSFDAGPDVPPPGVRTTTEVHCTLREDQPDPVRAAYPTIVLRRGGGDSQIRRLHASQPTSPEPQEGMAQWLELATMWCNKALGLVGLASSSQAEMHRRHGKTPIRDIACHPYVQKFAVARFDDAVELHGSDINDAGGFEVLIHDLHQNITCVQWSPTSASTLAIGSAKGVVVWQLNGEQPAVVRLLPCPAVSSLAWSPDGAFVAAASHESTALSIWDVGRHECTELRRGEKTHLLLWSPTGDKLLSADSSSHFRIWDARTWSCEKWNVPNSSLQTACWSPDGRVLLFVARDDTCIYSLQFSRSSDVNPESVVVFDTAKYGCVKAMAWDDSAERLALSLSGLDAVAILRTRVNRGHPELTAGGFVRGPNGANAQCLEFQRNVPQRVFASHGIGMEGHLGAVLAICWVDSAPSCEVDFLPFHFVPASRITHTAY